DVAVALRAAAAALGEAGYVVEEAEPPMIAEARQWWLSAVAAEARIFMAPAVEKFGDDGIKRAFAYFADAGATGLAGYMKALAARGGVLRAWMLFMQTYPLVLGPVSTAPAFAAGADIASAESAAAIGDTQQLLVAVNYLGLPSVAVPAGVIGGLPQG